MSKLTTAMACHFPGTFTVVPAIASATAERSVGLYRVNVRAHQIILPSRSHTMIAVSDSAFVRKAELDE